MNYRTLDFYNIIGNPKNKITAEAVVELTTLFEKVEDLWQNRRIAGVFETIPDIRNAKDGVVMYCGKNLREQSKDELIDIIMRQAAIINCKM